MEEKAVMTKSDIQNIKKDDIEKNQQEFDDEIKECWTTTHTFTALGFWVFAFVYATRINLSVAIIPMKDEFGWDQQTKGHILGAFFYGYIVTNSVGGRLGELYGGRKVTSIALMVASLLTMLTPIAARTSTALFITVRVIEGLVQGVSYPAVNALLSKWAPKEERARTSTRIFTGNLFGTFVTLPVCGWLSESTFLGGWPSVFYVTGFLGFFVGMLFFVFITEDPKDMKRISANELRHIQKYTLKELGEKEPPFPWKSIATSKDFWLIVLVHLGTNWGWYMLLTELPTYLNEILALPVHTVGIVAGLTYLGSWTGSNIYGSFLTRLILNKTVTITKARRISTAISQYGQAVIFFILLFVTSNAVVASILLILASIVYSPHYSGMMCSPSDISPRFAGSLMGISNTIGTIPGFLAPMLVGYITNDNQTEWAWRYIFIITIVIFVVCATPYVFFYKADIQPWNYSQDVTNGEENAKNNNQNNEKISADNAAFDTKF